MSRLFIPLVASTAALLAACGDSRPAGEAQAVNAPGHVVASGRTSGEVLAANAGRAPTAPQPAGTPGIPLGAEGNVGGTAPGGTIVTQQPASNTAAVAAPASTPGQGPPQKPSAEEAAAREKQQLAASMEAVAQRWRSRAAENQWAMHPATPVEAVAGIAEQTRPGSNPVAPEAVPGRSEKAGTAPASEDVKTGVQRHPPGVGADAPDKAPTQ